MWLFWCDDLFFSSENSILTILGHSNKMCRTKKAYRRVYSIILEVILLLPLPLGQELWSVTIPVAGLQKKVSRVGKAISKTAVDATGGDQEGFQAAVGWILGPVMNNGDNVAVFGHASFLNPIETHNNQEAS